ncbi:NlpC/P60 family protein [Sinosporangium album]|uniref:NlpC/P60 family protein n=1 Tax=Sinosporangium album TaxID=504805 RepID=A0A1G7RSX7_9ACTN|nr:C40 family peptidase [Sinosporangium album]SDG13957.1 NlpC/P60 family protein [Sinosporangium album]
MTAVVMLVLPVGGMLAGAVHGGVHGIEYGVERGVGLGAVHGVEYGVIRGRMKAGPSSQDVSARAVAFAHAQLGKPYRWGGTGPLAFDCSGLTMRAYEAGGIAIPRVAHQQWRAGMRVEPGQERPGDLVFFRWQARGPSHVGIVVGSGEMINSPRPGGVVRLASYKRRKDLVGFMRFVWEAASAPVPTPTPTPTPSPTPRPSSSTRSERPREPAEEWGKGRGVPYEEFDEWDEGRPRYLYDRPPYLYDE